MAVHQKWTSRLRRSEWTTLSRSKIALSAAVVVGVVSLALSGSWAAWTASDVNSANTFTTSTILISDNQGGEGGSASNSGTYLFNVTNLSPGSSATTACIGVDISGSPTSLTLAAALAGADKTTLQGELTLDTAVYRTGGTTNVTPGSNTNNGSCTGYPSSGSDVTIGTQGATLQAWAAGGPYTIAAPVTHTWYKFTVSGLPSGDTNCATYCNRTITIAFTWTLTGT